MLWPSVPKDATEEEVVQAFIEQLQFDEELARAYAARGFANKPETKAKTSPKTAIPKKIGPKTALPKVPKDGDGDGMIYDGTALEQPAPPKVPDLGGLWDTLTNPDAEKVPEPPRDEFDFEPVMPNMADESDRIFRNLVGNHLRTADESARVRDVLWGLQMINDTYSDQKATVRYETYLAAVQRIRKMLRQKDDWPGTLEEFVGVWDENDRDFLVDLNLHNSLELRPNGQIDLKVIKRPVQTNDEEIAAAYSYIGIWKIHDPAKRELENEFRSNGGGYRELNTDLREGTELNEYQQRMVDALQALAEKGSDHDGYRVYRGSKAFKSFRSRKDLVGMIFTDGGFVSSSTDKDVASGSFTESTGGVLFEYDIPAGWPVLDLVRLFGNAVDQREQEVVLPPGHSFEVIEDSGPPDDEWRPRRVRLRPMRPDPEVRHEMDEAFDYDEFQRMHASLAFTHMDTWESMNGNPAWRLASTATDVVAQDEMPRLGRRRAEQFAALQRILNSSEEVISPVDPGILRDEEQDPRALLSSLDLSTWKPSNEDVTIYVPVPVPDGKIALPNGRTFIGGMVNGEEQSLRRGERGGAYLRANVKAGTGFWYDPVAQQVMLQRNVEVVPVGEPYEDAYGTLTQDVTIRKQASL
jgi:hypothetical protein